MRYLNTLLLTILAAFAPIYLEAQETGNRASGLELNIEASGTVASGDYAPLWLSSNKYGLSSIESSSNYERLSVIRTIDNDSLRTWRLGYGADVAVAFNAARTLVIQQAFAEVGWKKAKLTIGAKEQPIMLKNRWLTSGALLLGTNARPIPQARLDIDYFNFPGCKGWWKWKLWGSYGKTMDGSWQRSYVEEAQTRYTGNVLYHEKALYWQFGKKDCCVPLTFDIALQMATEFGGKTYNTANTPGLDEKHPSNFKAYMNALLCSGSDTRDGAYANTEGNHVGSYNMALTWHGEGWKVKGYFERLFEDQSMMTVQYGIDDHLVGVEAQLPRNPFVSSLAVEHLSTRIQSGAVYHDVATNLPDAMNGRDEYYNHHIYSGWQHFGYNMGTPLLTSPIYNSRQTGWDKRMGDLYCYNNRVRAWHLALAGDPTEEINYRVLLSFTRNWGTYTYPLQDMTKQQYLLAEVGYAPERWNKTWNFTLGLAYDNGKLLGNSFGSQLTVRKTINLCK